MKENTAPTPRRRQTVNEMFEELMSQFVAVTGREIPPPALVQMKSVFFAGFSSCMHEFHIVAAEAKTEEEEIEAAAHLDRFRDQLAAHAIEQIALITAAQKRRRENAEKN